MWNENFGIHMKWLHKWVPAVWLWSDNDFNMLVQNFISAVIAGEKIGSHNTQPQMFVFIEYSVAIAKSAAALIQPQMYKWIQQLVQLKRKMAKGRRMR